MFTKKKPVRRDDVRITQYKTVIDWEAIGGVIVLLLIALAVLSSCGG